MSQQKILEGLFYTEEHEWVTIDNGLAVVGLTHYAQDQLGDITFVGLPELGDELEQMGEMCEVESVKAASDVYAPLSGIVAAVNEALEEHPELVNNDCYGEGWLVKIKGFDEGELRNLMDASAYKELLEGLEEE